jgi:hypothetical protein
MILLAYEVMKRVKNSKEGYKDDQAQKGGF